MVHKKCRGKDWIEVGFRVNTVTTVVRNYYREADRLGELGAYVADTPLAFENILFTSEASFFRPAAPFLWALGDLEWRRHGRYRLTP